MICQVSRFQRGSSRARQKGYCFCRIRKRGASWCGHGRTSTLQNYARQSYGYFLCEEVIEKVKTVFLATIVVEMGASGNFHLSICILLYPMRDLRGVFPKPDEVNPR